MRRARWRLIPESSDRPFLRALLLLGVFALVVLAFWWHFERRMDDLRRASMQDPARVLSRQDAAALNARRGLFRDGLGMDVLVRVEPESLTIPAAASPVLFVGVGRARGEAVIILPPLARRALGEHGEGLRLQTEETLARCLRHQPPGVCLTAALDALWQALNGDAPSR